MADRRWDVVQMSGVFNGCPNDGVITMAEFYVEKNAQGNGDHVVHTADCSLLPSKETVHYLGSISNAKSAVKKAAELLRKQASGCPHCTPAYQTT